MSSSAPWLPVFSTPETVTACRRHIFCVKINGLHSRASTNCLDSLLFLLGTFVATPTDNAARGCLSHFRSSLRPRPTSSCPIQGCHYGRMGAWAIPRRDNSGGDPATPRGSAKDIWCERQVGEPNETFAYGSTLNAWYFPGNSALAYNKAHDAQIWVAVSWKAWYLSFSRTFVTHPIQCSGSFASFGHDRLTDPRQMCVLPRSSGFSHCHNQIGFDSPIPVTVRWSERHSSRSMIRVLSHLSGSLPRLLVIRLPCRSSATLALVFQIDV